MTGSTKTINHSRPGSQTRYGGADSTNNQSSIITNQWKGEPNFNLKTPTKQANSANFTHNFSSKSCKKYKIIRKIPKKHKKKHALFFTFSHNASTFHQKCPKKRAFFHLFYPPKAENEPIYAKQTQFTNFENRESSIEHREYAKQTQFHQPKTSDERRETKIENYAKRTQSNECSL
ncbi:MAG: hypothetical protein ACYSWP_13930 [Planctomycetota bacterium]|jgi:hypothetical protein